MGICVNRIVFLVVFGLFLTSCSYVSNGEKYYMQARNGAPLVIPAPLSSSNISHFYDLPPQNGNATVSIAPPV